MFRIKTTHEHSRWSTPLALLLMVFAQICFTMTFVCIKIANDDQTYFFPLDPAIGLGEAVASRSFPLLIVSFIFILLKRKKEKVTISSHDRKWLIIRGACGATSIAFCFSGALAIPLAINSLFNNTSAFFVGVLAHFFLKERFTPFRLTLTLGGLFGVILVLADGFKVASTYDATFWDYLIALMAGFSSAVAYFSVRKAKSIPADYMVFSVGVFSCTLCVILFAINGIHLPGSWYDKGLLLVSGLFGLAAQYLLTWSFQMGPVALVALGQYLSPVFAVLIGYFYFGENIPDLATIGFVFVLFFGFIIPLFYTISTASNTDYVSVIARRVPFLRSVKMRK